MGGGGGGGGIPLFARLESAIANPTQNNSISPREAARRRFLGFLIVVFIIVIKYSRKIQMFILGPTCGTAFKYFEKSSRDTFPSMKEDAPTMLPMWSLQRLRVYR